MPSAILQRPGADDFAPYFARYNSLVPDGDLIEEFERQLVEVPALFARIGEARASFRYAPDKWSVREVAGHLIDTERVFSYRATQFSRGDRRPLPSFDQAAWVPFGEYDARTLDDLLDEWRAARLSTLALVRGMPLAVLLRRGIASEMEFSVLALLCIIAGHARYHLHRLPVDYAGAFGEPPG